jgi:uncharacterized protein (TIGR03435 family)
MKRALTGAFLIWAASAQQPAYDAVYEPVERATAELMFQNMLERFHLRVHHETTTVAGFHLLVDKGGSRLKVSEATGIGFSIQSMEVIRGPSDTPMLARYLTALLHAPVEIHTGLAGKYDMEVKWIPDNGASVAEPGPDIFMALRQQLGLSLEKVNVAIDLIEIDNVERPT